MFTLQVMSIPHYYSLRSKLIDTILVQLCSKSVSINSDGVPPSVFNIFLGVIDPRKPIVLVGDSLYMLLVGKSSSIIEFNFDRQSLAVTPLPVGLDIEFS